MCPRGGDPFAGLIRRWKLPQQEENPCRINHLHAFPPTVIRGLSPCYAAVGDLDNTLGAYRNKEKQSMAVVLLSCAVCLLMAALCVYGYLTVTGQAFGLRAIWELCITGHRIARIYFMLTILAFALAVTAQIISLAA